MIEPGMAEVYEAGNRPLPAGPEAPAASSGGCRVALNAVDGLEVVRVGSSKDLRFRLVESRQPGAVVLRRRAQIRRS
jgi:hypothetical protein